MKKKFEFFDHTADAMFRAYGVTLENKFVNAALALFSIMKDPEKIGSSIEFKISLRANDKKELLYSWIDELIFLVDAKYFMLHKVKSLRITKDKNYKLVAVVIGDATEGLHVASSGVKAATYNDMEIKDEYIQMVIDI
jgi:SHS2 domain-containing protein